MSTHRKIPLFGVQITDTTIPQATSLIYDAIDHRAQNQHVFYFVNTYTLNLAQNNTAYKAILNRADFVFGDGTGVRWATRLIHQIRLQDNVNGTDLVPRLLSQKQLDNQRFFLLGGTPEVVELAANNMKNLFPQWELAGYHHGYLSATESTAVIETINRAKPDLLLVGMGNPLQESWVDQHRDQLQVPVIMAVGGLFAYWAGDLNRAPKWMRTLNLEWFHIMLKQPHKWKRYLIGNWVFIARMIRDTIQTRL